MALKHFKKLFIYQPSFSSFFLHLQLNIVSRNVSICFIARLDDCLKERCGFIVFYGIGMDSASFSEMLNSESSFVRSFLLMLTILAYDVPLLISVLHHNETLMCKH